MESAKSTQQTVKWQLLMWHPWFRFKMAAIRRGPGNVLAAKNCIAWEINHTRISRNSKIEAIADWHLLMATIFDFICYHVYVAGWLRKWPKWAIGSTYRQLGRAPDMSGKFRTTWISDEIGTCPEKKLWNSVSGKYRTGLHLVYLIATGIVFNIQASGSHIGLMMA